MRVRSPFFSSCIKISATIDAGSPVYYSPERLELVKGLRHDVLEELSRDDVFANESYMIGLIILELLVHDDESLSIMKEIIQKAPDSKDAPSREDWLKSVDRGLRLEIQPLLDRVKENLSEKDYGFFFQLRHLLEYKSAGRLLLSNKATLGKLDVLYRKIDSIKKGDFNGLYLKDLQELLEWAIESGDRDLIFKIMQKKGYFIELQNIFKLFDKEILEYIANKIQEKLDIKNQDEMHELQRLGVLCEIGLRDKVAGTAMLTPSESAIQGKVFGFDPLSFDKNPAEIMGKLKGLKETQWDKLGGFNIDASKISKEFGLPDVLELRKEDITVILVDQPGMAVNYRIEEDGKERLFLVIDKTTFDEAQTNKLALKTVIENELFQLVLKRRLDLWDNKGLDEKRISEVESMSLVYLAKRVFNGDLAAEEGLGALQKLLTQMQDLVKDGLVEKSVGFSGDLSLYRNFLGDIIKALQPGAEVDKKKLERMVAFYNNVMNGYKMPHLKDRQASFANAEAAAPSFSAKDIFNPELMSALRRSA